MIGGTGKDQGFVAFDLWVFNDWLCFGFGLQRGNGFRSESSRF